jgi:hypothetical protein
MFMVYVRYFLIPISAVTWANLIKTLCASEKDVWSYHGKYYVFWGEIYLGMTSIIIHSLLIIISKTCIAIRDNKLSIFKKKFIISYKKSHFKV